MRKYLLFISTITGDYSNQLLDGDMELTNAIRKAFKKEDDPKSFNSQVFELFISSSELSQVKSTIFKKFSNGTWMMVTLYEVSEENQLLDEDDFVAIRFLKHGLHKAKKPDNFDTMPDVEKSIWAASVLATLSDHDIFHALAENVNIEEDGYFSATPLPEAIESCPDGDIIISSELWRHYIDEDMDSRL